MARTTTLLLVRHASAECKRDGADLLCGSYDAPISAEGWREIDSLRERLASENPLHAIYSSPLKRAVETAAAAPLALAPRLRLVRSLAEIHCGAVEGMSLASVRSTYPDLWQENEAQSNEQFCWPGGESYSRFRRRVMRAIRSIAHNHTGERVLIVTHAGVINQVLGVIAGQSAARWEHPRPRNASLTEVHWNNAGGCVARFDDCAHLRVLQP